MKPRLPHLLGLLIIAALAAGWMMSSSQPLPAIAVRPPAIPSKPTGPNAAPVPAQVLPAPAVAAPPPVAPAPGPGPAKPVFAPPTPPVALDARKRYAEPLEEISLMLRDYRTLMHENPVGTNAEIMAAIMGGNPKRARLGPPAGAGLNDQGELLDQWGTPYFFHQMSAKEMEIHSAGPDRKMWTTDDVVVR